MERVMMIKSDGRLMAEVVASLADGRVAVAVSYVDGDAPIYFEDMTVEAFESLVLTR
jgi:hypothetical protein